MTSLLLYFKWWELLLTLVEADYMCFRHLKLLAGLGRMCDSKAPSRPAAENVIIGDDRVAASELLGSLKRSRAVHELD